MALPTLTDDYVLECRRLAVRTHRGTWEWFSPTILHTVAGFFEEPKWVHAHLLMEGFCQQAILQAGITPNNAKIVIAPSVDAMNLVELNEGERKGYNEQHTRRKFKRGRLG